MREKGLSVVDESEALLIRSYLGVTQWFGVWFEMRCAGAGVWCVLVGLSDPVEMQPRGWGRDERGRGVVVGGELACYGPEAGR